ncbi:MAG: alpha/beta hydrolase, partial [Litorimonas sp.]
MKRVFFDLPQGRLSALRFGDADAPVRLVFCHANGFNARSYRAVIDPLGVPALALDLRGHGETRLPTDVAGLKNWQIFADDIAAVFDQAVSEPVVLAGHSYGAVSAILSLPRLGGRVAGYAGFDPVLVPWLFRQIARTRTGRAYMKTRIPIARKAGQRKSRFDSVEAAFERYRGRGAFKGVPDPVLRDYLDGGTRELSEGGVALACDPLWEQAIFVAQAHDLFRQVPRLPDASRIVFAGARGRVST